MKSNPAVLKFQKECFAIYLTDIQNKVNGFPKRYVYPDGNPIRPVIPVQTTTNKIMLVGAFPSARFEQRNGKLIPVGDNLAPFGPEHYFDGSQVRIQESTESLHKNYFPQLGIERTDLWITDIVKIYLYPDKHLKNFDSSGFVDTHKLFPKIAEASLEWFKEELKVCNPKLIITLGEVAARVVSQNSKPSLDGVIRDLSYADNIKIVHLAHPEIRRRNPEWDKRTKVHLRELAKQIKKYL
ncbi:MAG: uracil-DNA glycosylase family protein [Bacteroidota bacterium]